MAAEAAHVSLPLLAVDLRVQSGVFCPCLTGVAGHLLRFAFMQAERILAFALSEYGRRHQKTTTFSINPQRTTARRDADKNTVVSQDSNTRSEHSSGESMWVNARIRAITDQRAGSRSARSSAQSPHSDTILMFEGARAMESGEFGTLGQIQSRLRIGASCWTTRPTPCRIRTSIEFDSTPMLWPACSSRSSWRTARHRSSGEWRAPAPCSSPRMGLRAC